MAKNLIVDRDELNDESEAMSKTTQVQLEKEDGDASKSNIQSVSAAHQKLIDKASEAVQRLYLVESHSGPFNLGDGLTQLHDAMAVAWGTGRVTNAQLADHLANKLNLSLTIQRISSLRKTAEYFPKDSRKNRFSFKDYETARKQDEKGAKLGGEKLAAAMDSGDFQVDEKESEATKPTLTIRVKVDAEDGEKSDAEILVGGKQIETVQPWMIHAALAAIESLKLKFSL